MRFVCLLLFLAASAASAQEASVRFLILDLDQDGYVSLAEAAGMGDIVTRFERADADRDGRLSAKEFNRLDRLRVSASKPRRQHVRASVARDSREAQREAAQETAAVEAGASAAAGGSR